jgi:hypothetical protein
MDRLLAEIATALVAPQANTAALERLDKQFNKKMSNSRDPIREGLDIISPAVFVQVMDSLFVRRGGASGNGGAPRSAFDEAVSQLEVGDAISCGVPRPD